MCSEDCILIASKNSIIAVDILYACFSHQMQLSIIYRRDLKLFSFFDKYYNNDYLENNNSEEKPIFKTHLQVIRVHNIIIIYI